jgi:uncharacterized protein YecT (DUF1311 family)
MRKKVFTPLFCQFIFILLIFPVSAQPIPFEKPPFFPEFCSRAETPADFQECLNERLEYAQEVLNDIFSRTMSEAVDLPQIKKAQDHWIAYRTEQCRLERLLAKNIAYERTYELECMGRLTEERALFFYRLHARQKS